MKKYQLWIGALVLMLATTTYAQGTTIYIQNKPIKMEVAPQIKENTTFVPISLFSEELGENVDFENPRLIITKSPKQFIFTIGDKTVSQGIDPISLSTAPYLSNNHLFVPLRDLSELLEWQVDYERQSKSIHINPILEDDKHQITINQLNIPKLTLLNHNANYVTVPKYWNGKTYNALSIPKAISIKDEATTNIYRPQVNELFKFNFGETNPDHVAVRMEYLTDNLEEVVSSSEQVPVSKNGDYYTFNHQPISKPNDDLMSRIYVINATWGENSCEYAFVVDNKWNVLAHQRLEEKMKSLHVLDYCVIGNWVYYATLGDEEGFHKMLLDGTQDTIICDFSKIRSLNGSTSVTSEYKGDYILYKMQALRQYDANGQLSPPSPIDYYKLNLSDNTLEVIDK